MQNPNHLFTNRMTEAQAVELVWQNGFNIVYVAGFQDSINVVLEAVRQNGLVLEIVRSSFKSDKDVVNTAVSQNGLALQFASDALKDDRDVVLKAVMNDCKAYAFASQNLKNDREFNITMIEKQSKLLDVISREFASDESFIEEVLEKNGCALRYVHQDFKTKKNIVLKAVTSDGYALEFVGWTIDSYKEIVLAAMKQNLDASKFSKLTPLETKLLFKKITAEKLLPIKSLVEGISTMIEKYTGEQGELTLTHSIASYIQPFLTVKNASLMTQLNRQLSELTKAYPNGLK